MWALNRDFPHLEFSLNGGLDSCHQAAAALQHSVDGASIHGVMIGRAAYNHPWACLADADIAVFGAETNAATSRREVCTSPLWPFSSCHVPFWRCIWFFCKLMRLENIRVKLYKQNPGQYCSWPSTAESKVLPLHVPACDLESAPC